MEIAVNVIRASFSEEGVQDIITKQFEQVLKQHGIAADIFVESTDAMKEYGIDENGDPNIDFDCMVALEIQEDNGYSETEIENLLIAK